ncbi:MAG: Smr/MutS family protein [Desulfobacteraceae bacterium]
MSKGFEPDQGDLEPGVIEIPVDGALDLHTFDPRDAADVVTDYLDACLEKGITEIRIIHGKGKGILRNKVHAALRRHPAVAGFTLDSGPSGWGATVVRLSVRGDDPR